MNIKKSLAGAAVVGSLALGGAWTAASAFADTASPTPAPSASASAGTSTQAPAQGTDKGQRGQGQGQAPHQHTAATADETAKATAAVTAKDAPVTVTKVEKDPDGTFDASGTKDGANVMFDVSADYATVSDAQIGGPGAKGGHGGGKGGSSQDTPVTGTEADKVIAAVQAKDSTATITEVRKDPDGSYDAVGTKAGANVMFDVSADLQTITQAQR